MYVIYDEWPTFKSKLAKILNYKFKIGSDPNTSFREKKPTELRYLSESVTTRFVHTAHLQRNNSTLALNILASWLVSNPQIAYPPPPPQFPVSAAKAGRNHLNK